MQHNAYKCWILRPAGFIRFLRNQIFVMSATEGEQSIQKGQDIRFLLVTFEQGTQNTNMAHHQSVRGQLETLYICINRTL